MLLVLPLFSVPGLEASGVYGHSQAARIWMITSAVPSRAIGRFERSLAPAALDGMGQSPAPAETERRLRQAVELNPQSFDANHYLGEFYIHAGKLADGIPYLEQAQRLDPSHYDNGYDLALAYLESEDLPKARQQAHAMLERQNTAELHNLLGEIEEATGNSVTAANEYQLAAHMDPTEKYIFDWGDELLLHRAFQPALEVFKGGVERYPQSAKLHIGLGVAFYSQGLYDDAAQALCLAADLEPSDSRPYLFLGRMYDISLSQTDEVTQRLKRFVQLQPRNALAHFYYAMSLWKGQRAQGARAENDEIQLHLRRAATLDPKFADAHLQLGTLYASGGKYTEAVPEYQQAIKLKPDLPDAHYRLAQAYLRIGEKASAKKELDLYEALHKQQMLEAEKKQAEVGRFLYSLKDSP
jgi:tetratricopeptide (TPR) repeat protein